MKSVVVGTAGHIDHGKSALVQALTGTDPDRLREEKARGITIDLGFAHLVLDGLNLAFVDVPGHERFVKNMLAGVGGIDLVVLVVAADESVMPQTREHFDICRLLRVPSGIVAVTKADLVDADTMELAQLEIRELVAGSFLAGAPIVPVSARTGQGLDDLRAALVRAATKAEGRSLDGAARLPIDRVFSMKGFGTVVTGTLTAGRIRQDDELQMAPGDRRGKVRGVQVHGARQPEVRAGQRAAINLAGVDVHDVRRGQTLMAAGAAERTRVADAAIELLPDAQPIRHGARVRFHHGTAEIMGRVAIIAPPEFEPGPERPGSAPSIEPGSRAYVRLRLEEPAVLVRGDRFILRTYSPSRTIAGGRVLDPVPPRGGVRSRATLGRCLALDLDAASGVEGELRAAGVLIDEAGTHGLPEAALTSRIGIAPGDVRSRIDALVSRRAAIDIAHLLVAPRVVDDLRAAIVAALTAHHRGDPLSEGLAREEARARLFAGGAPAVFERAIDELAAAKTIVVRDRIALAAHQVMLTPDGERARVAIDALYRDAGLAPPDVTSLASACAAPPAAVDQALKLLQRQKVLVKIEAVLFHESALKRLKDDLAAMKASAGAAARLDVPAFKARFGVTRKFAIPLLEYLDRERITRRVGDARVLL